MIQARNKLSQEELFEAKKLINCCQVYDGTYRDPYLSNMLNFEPFSFIMKKANLLVY